MAEPVVALSQPSGDAGDRDGGSVADCELVVSGGHTANIGAVAAGKTPQRIDLGYDQPGGDGTYRGYVDDIGLNG
jgi:hypothetical protein